MRETPNLAVVGARSSVGQMALRLLSMREDRWGEIRALEVAERAIGMITCRGEELPVKAISAESFDGIDIVLLCAEESTAAQWAPVAAAAGAVVLDDSSYHRLLEDVPLVVPEVNPAQVRNRPRGIIANPSCTTLILLDVIAPLNSTWGLRELIVTTYQSASGVGDRGLSQLYAETAALAGDTGAGRTVNSVRAALDGDLSERSPFPAPLAYNIIPWIGEMAEGGWSSMERLVTAECRKVLGWGELQMSATCVRVPVAIGHSIAVHASFEEKVSADQVRRVLIEAPSVVVLDDPDHNEWPTPIDAVGSDPTFVGRIRSAENFPRSVDLFLCADNIRKGAALNLVQIAELVVDDANGRSFRVGDEDPEDDEES